ncbi:MAG: hypothetical protein JO297_19640 [Nitrososphaeraceae archaeon]|nr:hypothetical protein [Nitrososphaeraceae archaeon]
MIWACTFFPQVEWIYTRLSKEKAGKQMSVDMAEYLEEDEVQKLIESIHSVQKKAFIAYVCMKVELDQKSFCGLQILI